MNRPWIVGSFVLAGLALFATGIFMIGNRHEAFAKHTEFYAEFSNLSGVAGGTKVQVAGMDAGEVLDVRIPASPASRFRVRLQINQTLHGLVRTNSIVTISTEGVVGDKFLSIAAGTPDAPPAAPYATLSSRETTELSVLLDRASGTVTDIDTTVRNANNLITNANQLVTTIGGTLSSTLAQARKTITNADDVVVALKEGKGPAGMLLRDEGAAAQIRAAVTNTQNATGELNRVAEHASELVADIQSRGFPGRLDETLTTVHDTVSNLDATSKQIRQTVADLTSPDQNGITTAETLRDSFSNVDIAAANMAEDTEALKHNFLLRGFFRSRGYFSLDQLSPALYRKNQVFTTADNPRAWLRAEELFETATAGGEQLTPTGKVAVNNTLAKYGAIVLESPLVIEGYSDAVDSAQRLAASRVRAILVRNYVRFHLQLDPTVIGAVPMENQPPSGLDRSHWNGVAIVILKSRLRR